MGIIDKIKAVWSKMFKVNDVKKIFESSGVPTEKMADYDLAYKEKVGERTEFLAGNIAEIYNLNIAFYLEGIIAVIATVASMIYFKYDNRKTIKG